MAGAILLVLAKSVIAARDVIRGRRRFPNTLARSAALAAAAGCALYFAFVLAWGFNHYRRPVAESAKMNVSTPTAEELERLCGRLVRNANRLRGRVGENENGVFTLKEGPRGALARATAGFDGAEKTFGAGGRFRTAAPKAAALSPVMTALSISGYYFPYTAEPVVNTDVPHCSIPHAACHEIAHFAGFASEDEANYLGFVACRENPDPDFRYSGAFTALVYALSALRAADCEAYAEAVKDMDEGVKRDMKDLSRFWERTESAASRASRSVNDAYLKTHGKGGGIRSYGGFVDLLVAEMRRE
jgi:hypothetical protein